MTDRAGAMAAPKTGPGPGGVEPPSAFAGEVIGYPGFFNCGGRVKRLEIALGPWFRLPGRQAAQATITS
jgi:hypothetical protein